MLEVPRFIAVGDPSRPVTNYDTFTYKYELMSGGQYDKILYSSNTTITSNTTNNAQLQQGIRDLIPNLNVGSDVIVEVPPSKAHGNRPHPYYRTGHNVKFHIIVTNAQ